MYSRLFRWLILILAVLVAATSLAGIILPDTYVRESADWKAQGIAQDLFDLFFAVPALLISLWFFRKGSPAGFFMLAGILIFLIYTFIIYTFGVHFNNFFLIYCITLASSSYSLIYLFWATGSIRVQGWFNTERNVRGAVIYLYFFAALFYVLWLSEIIPAIMNNSVPAVLSQTGLFTNPVHVLDLSFLLPGFIITALLLKRRDALGYLFAPSIMTFSIVMTLSIATLIFYEIAGGFSTDYSPAIAMTIFALVSVLMFRYFMKNLKIIHQTK